jgi:hypothetical protein
LTKQVEEACYQKVYDIARAQLPKQERNDAWDQLRDEFLATLGERGSQPYLLVNATFMM